MQQRKKEQGKENQGRPTTKQKRARTGSRSTPAERNKRITEAADKAAEKAEVAEEERSNGDDIP